MNGFVYLGVGLCSLLIGFFLFSFIDKEKRIGLILYGIGPLFLIIFGIIQIVKDIDYIHKLNIDEVSIEIVFPGKPKQYNRNGFILFELDYYDENYTIKYKKSKLFNSSKEYYEKDLRFYPIGKAIFVDEISNSRIIYREQEYNDKTKLIHYSKYILYFINDTILEISNTYNEKNKYMNIRTRENFFNIQISDIK